MAKDGTDAWRDQCSVRNLPCSRNPRSKRRMETRGEVGITAVKRHALAILHAFGEADAQLVGKAVILTDGTAGTVESAWLDEVHGLRISIRGHPGKRPVSTVKFAQE